MANGFVGQQSLLATVSAFRELLPCLSMVFDTERMQLRGGQAGDLLGSELTGLLEHYAPQAFDTLVDMFLCHHHELTDLRYLVSIHGQFKHHEPVNITRDRVDSDDKLTCWPEAMRRDAIAVVLQVLKHRERALYCAASINLVEAQTRRAFKTCHELDNGVSI